jgi:cardiolipin synthase A/B
MISAKEFLSDTTTNQAIKEAVFADAGQYFTALMQDIEQAASQIDLETYIFDLDPLGRKVAERLAAASSRGVTVRLLLDGAGSSISSGVLAQQLSSAGAQVRIYHPLPWNISHWEWAVPRQPWLAKLQRLQESMHSRNHRKICMIDQRIVWVGSFNISQCHLPKDEGGQGWRDTALRLEDLDLEHLQQAFESAWNNDRSLIPRRIFSPANIRLNHMHRRKLRRDLLKRMTDTRERIWITNAYFVPVASILRFLKKAARRGVDVRLLLPGNSDVFFMPWASAVFYQTLLKAGVKIYEYTGGMLHAKIMILDDWITVGSSNMDYLSFFRNLEAEVVVTQPATIKTLEDQFLYDLTQAAQITIADCRRRPWWKKLLGRFLLNIKRWL